MLKLKTLIVFGLFFYSILDGQEQFQSLKKITPNEGLSQDINEFIYQDKNGYIWIGSLEGVNLFNGQEIKVFKTGNNDSLSINGSNIQSSFFEDKFGTIWFTTDEGFNGYKKNEGYFIHPSIDNSDEPTRHYAFHIENEQFIWIIKNGNLYRYDSKMNPDSIYTPIVKNIRTVRSGVSTDSSNKVQVIFNTLLVLESGFETIKLSEDYQEVERKKWFGESTNPENFTLIVYQIIGGRNSAAWILTNKGLLYFDANSPNNYKLYNYPDTSIFIKSIAPVSEKYFNVLLSNSSISKFDKFRKSFEPETISFFDFEDKQTINKIDLIFSAKDSIHLFSTRSLGIWFGNEKSKGFSPLFNNLNLPRNPINHITKTQENIILCVSYNSLSHIFHENKNTTQGQNYPRGFKQIIDSKSNIWNISFEKFCRGKSHSEIINNTLGFFDILNLNERFLILATRSGIFLFDKNSNNLIPSNQTEFTTKIFYDSQKRLWFGDATNKLTISQLSFENIANLEKLNSFPNFGLINDIKEDPSQKYIWIATSKGLAKINSETFDYKIITENDGLPNQYIHAILFDGESNLWLSTNKGIIKYIPKSNQFKHYTSRDGLSSNEYLPGSALLADDGKMWFGSTKGVDVFHPDSIKTIGKKPRLAINSLKIHGKEKKFEEGAINYLDKIVLRPDENTLNFELAALEYTDPQRNQFKAWLTNNGKTDTFYQKTDHTINLINLSSGEYDFGFTACNAEGIWQDEPHSLKIFIEYPLHQTWWFRALVVLFLMGLVGFISTLYYRYQLREKQLQLEKQEREAERQRLKLEKKSEVERLELERKIFMEKERTRIAGEMHDEIGSGLTTIRRSTAKANDKSTTSDLQKILKRVSKLSIGIINSMQSIIWAMDPDYDSLEDLCAYIRRYSREYLDDNQLNATISIPYELPDLNLNGQTRHNIILTIKEALHNIVKHSEAKNVTLELSIEDKLSILIKDDGKGFEKENLKRRGHGLKSMSNRMKTLKGNIEWLPNNPKGTVVKMEIPL